MKFSRRIVSRAPRSHPVAGAPWITTLGIGALVVACDASGSSQMQGMNGEQAGGPGSTATATGVQSGNGAALGAGGTAAAPGAAPGEDFMLGEDFVFGGPMDVAISVGEVNASAPTGVGGASAVDEGDEDAMPLVACDAARASGDAPLIDDFEDADDATLVQDGREGSWYPYNSDDSDAHVLEYSGAEDIPGAGGMALHTFGSGYSWAGIGFGLRWGAEDADGIWQDCFYDASAYVGVRFWARGNGVTVNFNASMPEVIPIRDGGLCDTVQGTCWNAHGMNVTFGAEWQRMTILFDDMLRPAGADIGPLDPSRIRSMQFDIPENAEFDFWLDDLTFVTEADVAGDPTVMDPDPEEDGGAP